jgi:hypothetical protein
MQLIHAALAAERAVMYGLNFDLPKYEVHNKVLELHRMNCLGKEFCQSEDGLDLFKVAFESVSHACASHPCSSSGYSNVYLAPMSS